MSLLRKREDSLLLRLNLLAESWLPDKNAVVIRTVESEEDDDDSEAEGDGFAQDATYALAASVDELRELFVGNGSNEPLQLTLQQLSSNLAAVNFSLQEYSQTVAANSDKSTTPGRTGILGKAR